MAFEEARVKAAASALRVITAMDKRKSQGTFDKKCEAALEEAERQLANLSSRTLLPAFRAWRDGGVQAFDPTGGPVRDERGGYTTTAMRARNGA